jgi:hypothetical protein
LRALFRLGAFLCPRPRCEQGAAHAVEGAAMGTGVPDPRREARARKADKRAARQLRAGLRLLRRRRRANGTR